MENRQYMIFDISEINTIDFTEVLQTSAETLRITNDGLKSFVKWKAKKIYTSGANPVDIDDMGMVIENEAPVDVVIEDYIPNSIKSLTTKQWPYTESEIGEILLNAEWIAPNPDQDS